MQPSSGLALRYVGLTRPYRFGRTLVFLATLVLAIVVGATALHFHFAGKLTAGTPRAWYYAYLTALVAFAFVLVPRPRWAAVVLSLLTLEIGLGLGSAITYKYGLSQDALLPDDYLPSMRFTWHPLLQAVPLPTPPDEAATARNFHNSEGLRGPERTAASLRDRIVIAVVGGSTTHDFASPEGESWPDRLEEILGRNRFAVLNHGVPGYSTAEHIIQTAFYQTRFGTPPRCAAYYIGWNDLSNAHRQNLDSAYADVHLPSLVDSFDARRIGGPYLSVSPTFYFVGRLAVLAFDTVRPPHAIGTLSSAPDPALEAIYARNIGTISAINRQRGIKTIWIGQIMNRSVLNSGKPSGWSAFIPDNAIWPLIERLNGVTRRRAEALGDTYVDIPVDRFMPDDFVDRGHFTPKGSLKFATLLAPSVAETCN